MVPLIGRPTITIDPAWVAEPVTARTTPNIYVVVADGHGRPDVLADLFGYDSTPFLNSMKSNGFDYLSNSRANYLNTEQSFPSFMSGMHLRDLGVDISTQPSIGALASALVAAPSVPFLERRGYDISWIPSGYDHVGDRTLGRNIDSGDMSTLEKALLESSGAEAWLHDQIEGLWLQGLRQRTEAGVHAMATIAQSVPGPHAVFLHLPVPHPPFVFDSACGARPVDSLTYQHAFAPGPELSAALMAQGDETRCVDHLLLGLVTKVVAADPSAIVIVMSDHGPDVRLDWASPAEPGLNDRSASLLLVRTPGYEELMPADMTLVNLLPRLFNAYFGTDLPLRPDDVYVGDPARGGALFPTSP